MHVVVSAPKRLHRAGGRGSGLGDVGVTTSVLSRSPPCSIAALASPQKVANACTPCTKLASEARLASLREGKQRSGRGGGGPGARRAFGLVPCRCLGDNEAALTRAVEAREACHGVWKNMALRRGHRRTSQPPRREKKPPER